MESTSFSPGHNYVCQRLTPEHRIYYFVPGNTRELRYRNPKASPAMTPGFEPIAALWWWSRRREAVFPDSFANGTGGGFRRAGPASRVRRETTRSSFTSFRELR